MACQLQRHMEGRCSTWLVVEITNHERKRVYELAKEIHPLGAGPVPDFSIVSDFVHGSKQFGTILLAIENIANDRAGESITLGRLQLAPQLT